MNSQPLEAKVQLDIEQSRCLAVELAAEHIQYANEVLFMLSSVGRTSRQTIVTTSDYRLNLRFKHEADVYLVVTKLPNRCPLRFKVLKSRSASPQELSAAEFTASQLTGKLRVEQLFDDSRGTQQASVFQARRRRKRRWIRCLAYLCWEAATSPTCPLNKAHDYRKFRVASKFSQD